MTTPTERLREAIRNNNLELVKYLIEKGADVNVKGWNGNTPLSLACGKGHLELAKYLIEEKGANVNVKDKYGNTPLSWACHNGHLELAKYLIEEKGADVNAKNKYDDTPLMRACENGHLEFAKYLHSKILSTASNLDAPELPQTVTLKEWVKVPNAPYPALQNITRDYKKSLSDMRDNSKRYLQQLKDTDIKKLLCGNAQENAFLKQCNFYPLLKELLIKRAKLELACLNGGQLKPRLNALSVLTCRLVAAQEKLLNSDLLLNEAQQQFTQACAEAIKDARPELSKHRSTAGLILKCIVSLLILPVFIYTGLIKGTLFKTDTENKIDRLASELGLFKPNALELSDQKEGKKQRGVRAKPLDKKDAYTDIAPEVEVFEAEPVKPKRKLSP